MVRVIASGAGDAAGLVEVSSAIGGVSVLPLSPVHLEYVTDGAGDAIVTWSRRSRAGWRWIDGVDAPLAEEIEAYGVTITPTLAPGRTEDLPTPSIRVTAAERTGGTARVSIVQRGLYGQSLPAMIDVSAL